MRNDKVSVSSMWYTARAGTETIWCLVQTLHASIDLCARCNNLHAEIG
jgi:hypothetical protein